MPTYLTFIIKKRKELKEAINAQSTLNCGDLIQSSADIFCHLFEKENLYFNNNKDTINRALNTKDTFSEPIFNSILCCLFDACLSENKNHSIKHNLDDFKKFYDAIGVPEKPLSTEKLKSYNSIIRRMLDKSPHLSGLGLQMRPNWKLFTTETQQKEESPESLKLDSVKIEANQVNILTQKTDFPKKLNIIPNVNPRNVIGRNQELEQMKHLLFEEQQSVLVKGIGGIGKSTLVSAYCFKYFELYDHIAYLTMTNSGFANDIFNDSRLIHNLKIDIANKKSNLVLEEVLTAFNQISADNKLLVIDNADNEIIKYIDLLPSQPDWHLIISSRESLPSLYELELELPDKKNSILLFKKYCSWIESEDDIENIVESIERHPLTIELLAKTVQKQRLNIETVKKSLQNDIATKVTTQHSKNKPIDRIMTYLSSIFEISGLTTSERMILTHLSCFPSGSHSFKTIVKLSGFDSKKFDDSISEDLENLSEKGWITSDYENNSYNLHQILKLVVQKYYSGKYNEESETYLFYKIIGDLVAENADSETSSTNVVSKVKWFPYAESLYKLLINDIYVSKHIAKEDIILSYIVLASQYFWFDKEKTATILEEYLLNQMETIESINDKSIICAIYIQAVFCYYQLGDQKNYTIYSKKLNELDYNPNSEEEDDNGEHEFLKIIDTAIYTNKFDKLVATIDMIAKDYGKDSQRYGAFHVLVGIRFYQQEKYEEALIYYKKAENIYTKIFTGIEDLETAKLFSNIGECQKALANYKSAIEYFDKSSSIFDSVKGELNHSTTENVIEKIMTLIEAEKFDIALNEAKSYSLLLEKTKGRSHVKLPQFYHAIGIAYLHLKNYKESEKHFREAIKSHNERYGREHPNSIDYAYSLAKLMIVVKNENEAMKILEDIYPIAKEESKQNEKLLEVYTELLINNAENYDQALIVREKILDVRREFYGESSIQVANCYSKIGTMKTNLKLYNEAFKNYKKALEIKKGIFPKGDQKLIVSYYNLAICLFNQKLYMPSRTYLNEAIKIDSTYSTSKKSKFLYTLLDKINLQSLK